MAKIKSIEGFNFGGFEHFSLVLDSEITYLIGKNGSGKTTHGRTAIEALFGGIAEKASRNGGQIIGERFRFITDPEKKAEVIGIIEEDGHEFTLRRIITEKTTTLKIEAPPEYSNIDKDWVAAVFNEFLIAPQKFIELSPLEQTEALGIDTSAFDDKIKDLKNEFSAINRQIKGFGTITPKPKTEYVDITKLNSDRNELENIQKKRVDLHNSILEFKETISQYEERITQLMDNITNLSEKIETQEADLNALPDNSEKLTEIQNKFETASEQNLKYNEYQKYLEKLKEQKKHEKMLSDNKEAQKKQEAEKVEYMQALDLPLKTLSVDDQGRLLCEGKLLCEPYFSSGELLKIVPLIAEKLNKSESKLKYIFIQKWNLIDEDAQTEIEEYWNKKGYQLCIEHVGSKPLEGKNCVMLEKI